MAEVISVVLELIDEFSEGIQRASWNTNRFHQNALNLAQAFAPVSAAAGGALGASIKLAADFDAAVQGAVRGLDLAGSEVEEFKTEIQGLQKELLNQFTSTELANIATSAGKLGIAREELSEFTKGIAQLAVATDQADNIEDLATNAAKISSVFKLTVADTHEYLAAVNKLDDASSSTSNQILDFTQRVAGISAASKLAATDVAAFGATLVSSGIEPAVAATYFNKYLTVLGSATNLSNEAQESLAAMGFEASQLALDFDRDAIGTINRFNGTLKSLDTVTQRDFLGDIFGQDHVDTAQLMVQQSDELVKYLGQASDATGNAAKVQNEFNKSAQSFSGLSKNFTTQLEEIGVQLGTAILPGIIAVMNLLSPLLQGIVSITQQFPVVSTIVAILLGITAVIAPLLGIVGIIAQITIALPIMQGMLAGIAVGTWTALAPALLFVAAIATIGYLAYTIWQNWEPLKELFFEIWNNAQNSALDFHNWLIDTASQAVQLVIDAFMYIPTQVYNAFNQSRQAVHEFINWVGSLGGQLAQSAFSWGTGLVSGFISGIQSMYSQVASTMGEFTNWVGQYLPHSDAQKGELSRLTQSGRDFASTFLDGISGSNLDSQLSNAFSSPTPTGLNQATSSNGGSNSVINFSPVYNIDALNPDDLIKQLKTRDRDLIDLIDKAINRINRRAY